MTVGFQEKLFFERHDIIELVSFMRADGIAYYAYLRCGQEGYVRLQEDMRQRQSRALSAYGDVLFHGYGAPDIFVKREMFEAYGVPYDEEDPAA